MRRKRPIPRSYGACRGPAWTPLAFSTASGIRWARPEAKVIIVEPRFQAFPPDRGEHALIPLLTALRTTTVPESLSLANDGLRFVGRLARPGPEAWSQFEAEAWPRLTGEVAKSLRSRQRREVAALEQRVQDVLESTSYKAGQILVRSAQEPRSLWKVPFGLWRLYRSAEARKRSRHVTLPSSSIAPAVSIPALRPPPSAERWSSHRGGDTGHLYGVLPAL